MQTRKAHTMLRSAPAEVALLQPGRQTSTTKNLYKWLSLVKQESKLQSSHHVCIPPKLMQA